MRSDELLRPLRAARRNSLPAAPRCRRPAEPRCRTSPAWFQRAQSRSTVPPLPSRPDQVLRAHTLTDRRTRMAFITMCPGATCPSIRECPRRNEGDPTSASDSQDA
jgi:hypothetical protein